MNLAPFLFAALMLLLSGCATVPDVNALLHTNPLYLISPTFVGPDGPVTPRQARHIITVLEDHQQVPSDLLARHIAFEQAISNVPLTLGNKVTLLENGAATYNAMLSTIRNAHSSINMEMYIFSDGKIGQAFADALIERQRHGVQVNLMYDALGSLSTSSSFFNRLRQNGIVVTEYRPLDPFSSELHWTPAHRSHRKMLIVDGRIAFTGGVNISEVYSSGFHGEKTAPLEYWRDTDIEVEGPAAAEFQRLFITEWNYQKGLALMPRDYFPRPQRQGKDIVRVIASVPERFSSIYVTLISAIVNSETNVYITDAYFAPDRQMLHALENAARRGVHVELLVPSQSDEPLTVSAGRSHYASLLKAGVKIYEWRGQMLHAKTATVDGVWSTVGTSNLDWWSITRDNEVNAIILGHSFAQDMEQMFRNDLRSARQIELAQWKDRGMGERLDETFAQMVQPLL